jgi:hypothetical protein
MALIRSSQNAVAQHAIILDALDVKAAQLSLMKLISTVRCQ